MLLLDVDGPLNVFGGDFGVLSAKGFSAVQANGYAVMVNPAVGELLKEFAQRHGMQLVWATMWQELAHEHIAPIFSFEQMPHVSFAGGVPTGTPIEVYTKTPNIAAACGGRPFAWLDDEITQADVEWMDRNCSTPHLLVPVSAATGITRSHLDTVAQWVTNLQA